jgi:hypothetical protein
MANRLSLKNMLDQSHKADTDVNQNHEPYNLPGKRNNGEFPEFVTHHAGGKCQRSDRRNAGNRGPESFSEPVPIR